MIGVPVILVTVGLLVLWVFHLHAELEDSRRRVRMLSGLVGRLVRAHPELAAEVRRDFMAGHFERPDDVIALGVIPDGTPVPRSDRA